MTAKPERANQQQTLAEAAAGYAAHGWRVVPVHSVGADGACSCRRGLDCSSPGKHPRIQKWTEQASADASQVRSWWAKWPQANIGLATGSGGPVVVDLDGPAALDTLAAHAAGELGELPDTLTVTTGREGGQHRYFQQPDGFALANTAGKGDGRELGDSLDFRGNGGMVLLPPSVHASGKTYEWTGDWTQELPELPQPWCAHLGDRKPEQPAPVVPLPARAAGTGHSAYGQAALDRELEKLAGMEPNSGRNNQLYKSAAALGELIAGGELDESAAVADLRTTALHTGLPADEVEDTLQSGLDKGRARPRRAPEDSPGQVQSLTRARAAKAADPAADGASEYPNATDTGNAQRLVNRHQQDLRYCAALGGWQVWTGRNWTQDTLRKSQELAKQTALSIHAEAGAASDSDERRLLGKWALRSESKSRIDAMLELAASRPELVRAVDDFDADPYLLNCANGTLDLQTGKLRDHRREDHCTQALVTAYKPDAEAPVWDRFLETVLPDPEVRAFVQRAAGWSLTGDTSPQAFLLLHGTGANGKSVLLSVLSRLLEGYAANTPAQTLMAQRYTSGATADLARLRGVRMVTASESGDGDRLDTARVKALTGGDRITARHLYAAPFEFVPQFSLWLATNHLPVVKDQDFGIWRRVALVRFPVTIAAGDQDRYLERKLRDESEGILAWAVRGWLDFQKAGGLAPPEAVQLEVEAYKEEQDTLAPFLEACTVASPNARVAKGELHSAYKSWCDQVGERALSMNALGRKLKERGYADDKTTGGKRVWLGIGLEASLLDSRQ